MIVLGLSNCDTCRKARKALEAAGYDVVFRDVRRDPLGREEWSALLDALGDDMINRRSTTWRGLSEVERASPSVGLLGAHPALMKRPVCWAGRVLTLGWDARVQDQWISDRSDAGRLRTPSSRSS